MAEGSSSSSNNNDSSTNATRDVSFNNPMDSSADESKTIETLKNRGSNQANFSRNLSGRDDNNTGKKGLPKENELDEVEREKEEKNNKDKNTKDKGKDKEKKDNRKATISGENDSDKKGGIFSKPTSKIKKLISKVKMGAIILAACSGIILIIFFVAALTSAFDAFFNAISNFFGVSEGDTKANLSTGDGLLTSDTYLIDATTGESYDSDQLVNMLTSDTDCLKSSLFKKISDGWSVLWTGGFDNTCSNIRFINSYEEKFENKYANLELDRGLIISTLFYGYTSQADPTDYKNGNGPNVINGADHYAAITNVYEDGIIKQEDLKKIIEESFIVNDYTYYSWEILDDNEEFDETIEDVDQSEEEVKKSVGYCVSNHVEEASYSIEKWKVFMRYGEANAAQYVKIINDSLAYGATDDECKGKYTEEELLEKVKSASGDGRKATLDGSVNQAINYMNTLDYTGDITGYTKGADPESNKYDSLQYSYSDGFAYEKFPVYKQAIENEQINISYDSLVTPKAVETTIEYIIDKKFSINSSLNLKDQDKTINPDSYDNKSSVKKNVECSKYVPTDYEDIHVVVSDCDGRSKTVVTFQDYIVGTAYGELGGYSSNKNLVIADMVANISYVMSHKSNAKKGKTISVNSCDSHLKYCSMYKGCNRTVSATMCTSEVRCNSYLPPKEGESPNFMPAASREEQSEYASYYRTAIDYLLVKNGSILNPSTVEYNLNTWKDLANAGNSFTSILQSTFGNDNLMQCKSGNISSGNVDDNASDIGSGSTSEYPETAPNYGKFIGFSYKNNTGTNITINPAWVNENIISISSNCANGGWNQTYKINKAAKSNYEEAFKSICSLLTTGVIVNGKTCKLSKNALQNGDTFVQRKTSGGSVSINSYGIAQDWNYDIKLQVGNTTYKPYALTGSEGSQEYQNFIKALGREEHCDNINYILYKYAYGPAGFSWGGKSNSEEWNGMKFYISK